MDERAYRQAEQRLWASVDVAPTERRVTLPRLGVAVRVQEVGDGPPVLFVHGGPNAGAGWAPLIGELDGFRSLLIDRPGTGLSEPLAIDRGNVAEVGDTFVADVLDALELDRAHVVASSFGGFLALRSAAATPQRVERMVQMACPAGAPGMGMPGFMKALVAPGLGRLVSALPASERAARMTLRQIGHAKSLDAGGIAAAVVDWFVALQRHTDTMRHEARLIAGLGSLRGWADELTLTDALLARVTTLTHFLWGPTTPSAAHRWPGVWWARCRTPISP